MKFNNQFETLSFEKFTATDKRNRMSKNAKKAHKNARQQRQNPRGRQW